jgi:hypothetical protein
MVEDRLKTWEVLFQHALELIDSANAGGAKLEDWSFGGGTVLMRRHHHRFSRRDPPRRKSPWGRVAPPTLRHCPHQTLSPQVRPQRPDPLDFRALSSAAQSSWPQD